ncbi:TrkA C-terminal domain-containing protein [Exiguobacterium sp. 22311]
MTVTHPQAEIIEVRVSTNSVIAGRTLQDIEMPQDVLVVAIIREDEILTPRGQTRVLVDDQLLILTPKQADQDVRRLIVSLGL